MNYLSKAQYSAAKGRLTRAKNSGDPQRVIDEVTQTFEAWDTGQYAYPDTWHDWQRAREDAGFELRMTQSPW